MTSISVVICAHREDRWDATLEAVASVGNQSLAAVETILVVDHNPALRARLASALPDVTVTENREEQGLSGARNTGIALARGEIVAFLDDDAVADPRWLEFLADSYSDPAVAGVGGRTLPRWQTRQPSWFPDEFAWVVGCTYLGMSTSHAPVRNLHGGNASFRREVWGEVGGFRNGIGRSASKQPFGCEETEFCVRLGQRRPGSVMIVDDRAVVWHLVTPERCRFSYFRARCYAEGFSKAMVAAMVGARDGLSVERRYMARTLPRGVGRGLIDLAKGRPAGLGRAGAIVVGLAAASVGFLAGSMRRRDWHRARAAAPPAPGRAPDRVL